MSFNNSTMDAADNIRRIKSEAANKQPKPRKPIAKKSAKKLKQEAEEKKLRGDDDTLIEQWFKARRKELTGKCDFCGGKTEKHSDATFRFSIAHLFAKRPNMFPSVATHPANYLELCYYGNSCHSNFDNGMISWELLKDSKEWALIVNKFKEIYPFIEEFDRKNIPAILLKEL